MAPEEQPVYSVIAYETAESSNQAIYRLSPTSRRLSTLSSASLERGYRNFFFYPFPYPLSAAGEERVVQRSADRMSLLYTMQLQKLALLMGYCCL
jgi:hypothetical protein